MHSTKPKQYDRPKAMRHTYKQMLWVHGNVRSRNTSQRRFKDIAVEDAGVSLFYRNGPAGVWQQAYISDEQIEEYYGE